jgi:vacuolar-type H+-ATPase subunit E/Vma4
MIETPQEVSFFEAFAQIVRASGLSHAEIARRANKRLKDAFEQMLTQIQDPAERILTKMAKQDLYIHRSTISRAVRAIDRIEPETLERIGLGLNLDQDTVEWLKKLLEVEAPAHHSTQSRSVVQSSEVQVDQLPSWIRS